MVRHLLYTAAPEAAARRLREATGAAFDIVHPEQPEIRGVTHVQLLTPPTNRADPTSIMVIMPTGNVDRSPCGTGTTAKVATLFARWELALEQPFVHRSVTGATFTGSNLGMYRYGFD